MTQEVRGQVRLDELRRMLSRIDEQARLQRDAAQAELPRAKRLLDALGPAPGEKDPPEAPGVAQNRRTLNEQLAKLTGEARQADLLLARVDAMETRVLAASRSVMQQALLQRQPTLFAAEPWRRLAPAARTLFHEAVAVPALQFLADLRRESLANLAVFAVTVVAAIAAALALGRLLRGRIGRKSGEHDPTYPRRLVAALAEGLARTALPGAIVLALYAALLGISGWPSGPAALATALVGALLVGLLISGLSRAALSPAATAWRLLPIEEDAALRLNRWLQIAAGLVAVEILVSSILRSWGAPHLALVHVWLLLLSAATLALMLRLTSAGIWRVMAPPPPGDGEEIAELSTAQAPSAGWRFVGLALRGGAFTAFAAALVGYYRLADYMVAGTLASALIAGFYYLAQLMVRDGLPLALTAGGGAAARLRQRLGVDMDGADRLSFWIGLAAQLLLLAALCLALLMAWGVGWMGIADTLHEIGQGFQIGGVSVKPGDIGIAVLAFVIGVLATRAVKRALRKRLLPHTRLDRGVRDSIVAGVGYLGIVIAGAFAISALGLDLTNIALIASALSVGIGFGLQSIVNNFVSGIILLIERPIKVGDWVVVGSNEGHVRRISVRSTEIETFRRAAVIIPNSEVLSSALVNWTHKDKSGRVEVKIGVDYSTDPEKVRDLLLACVKRHAAILDDPHPFVVFEDFGSDALIFSVRGFIADVSRRLQTESELRFMIEKALRQSGIVFPYPQREISFRDWTQLEEMLRRVGRGRDEANGPVSDRK